MTRFDFYLLNLSFRAPEQLELQDLRDRIEHLASDCEFIRDHSEVIYRHPSIYEEKLWSEHRVLDVLYMPEVSEELGRDHHYFFQVIIDHSTETLVENEDLLELLPAHDQSLVNGLLCLHDVPEVDRRYCVYNRNDWFAFRRYFLGLYPISEEWFVSQCTILFPEIHFQNQINNTLRTLEGGGLSNFCIAIIYCLTCLNDKFKSCLNINNIPDSLRRFTSISGIETSNEGNAARRDDLSFSFRNKDNVMELVYCEPHMRLSQSDRSGDNTYRYNRIYFHPGKDHIAEGKILVGHIGGHL